MKIDGAVRRLSLLAWLLVVSILGLFGGTGTVSAQCTNANTKTANVVALDQPWFWNRLGAVQPQGQIFALRRNVIAKSGNENDPLVAGQVMLRKEKRPRPLVLRMNVGDCLQINFTNLINPNKDLVPDGGEQPRTRDASIRGNGLQLVGSIASDGSYVGKNASSVVPAGGSAIYRFYAEREGTHLLYSQGTTTGGEGDGGQLNAGLFGAVHVEPAGSEYYRSQVNAQVMAAVSSFLPNGNRVINYQKLETPTLPYLKMVNSANEIVHSDLTAIITGPSAGPIQPAYPLVKVFPERQKPFREFTIIYHDEIGAVQAFPHFKETARGLVFTLQSVRDGFALNYGTGGIGAEILANRLQVGPMHKCQDCMYEEFFLSAWAIGDPAQVVDVPANAPCKIPQLDNPDRNGTCDPQKGPKATKVLYPDDPSNVYHTYIGDHTKFRILHGGSKEHHIHHLHAHQWLRTPDSDNSSYLDSQALGPGYSFTTEIAYNGSGNRNQTVGDAIFHCHFYPHFAMGMWALWRSHDVFEAGTALDATGKPAPGSRALPDGEIAAGTPIPGLIPMPTYAMAPNPQQQVSIVNGQVVYGPIVAGTDGNPGYPFFIPGLAGHRPPGPPMDFARDPIDPTQVLDGGLPRHIVRDGTFFAEANRLSFDKFLLTADAVELPEGGTPEELRAMAFHARASHSTQKPDGTPATFITNGKPPVQGAPYADPCKGDPITPNPPIRQIVYRAAAVQFDLAINKVGWHFPQTRILTLWNDVIPTITGKRPAEP
ncbi:MAG TPA: copper oxidase, partial [Blastocatellia bacterium]|nr:copper oxidase [Blastocatellia bacterium]